MTDDQVLILGDSVGLGNRAVAAAIALFFYG